MADNLGSNIPMGGANSNINNVPAQSPLEQSAPVTPQSDLPPTESIAQEPAPASPIADTQVPAAETSPAPPMGETDFGQSAAAPDTDEFLKSILQQQPQTTTPVEPVSPVAPIDPMSSARAINQPLQEQAPAIEPSPVPTTPSPELNDKPIDQSQNLTTDFGQSAAPAMPVEPPTPETVPVPVPANQSSPLSDNISLDGVTSQPATPAPASAPVPPQTSDAAAGGIFAAGQSQGGSGLKKMIIGVLVLIVLAGGYYAYSTLFGSKNSTENTQLASKNDTNTNTNLTSASADNQRKSDLAVIQQALLNLSAGDGGRYPEAPNFIFLNQPGNILEQKLIPNYLREMPTDPSPTKSYAYKSDGTTFILTAELDDANDPDAVLDSGKLLYQVTPTTINPVSGNSGQTTSNSSTFPPSNSVSSSVTVQSTSTPASVPPVPMAP